MMNPRRAAKAKFVIERHDHVDVVHFNKSKFKPFCQCAREMVYIGKQRKFFVNQISWSSMNTITDVSSSRMTILIKIEAIIFNSMHYTISHCYRKSTCQISKRYCRELSRR